MDNLDKNEIPYVEDFKGIDFKALISRLIDGYRVILKWCGVALVVGLIVAFSIPKKYTVITRMSLESSSGSSSSSGALSSLAGLAGINLGSLASSSDSMSPELYPEILTSTPFVLELFPITVDFKDRKGEHVVTYYEYVKDYMREPWWNAVIRFPQTVLGWITGLFQSDNDKPRKNKKSESEQIDFSQIDPSRLTMEEFGIAGAVRKNIVWAVDKKTSAILLSASAQHPDVAMQVSEEIINLLQEYLIGYRTEKARRDLEYYQQLYDEAKKNYYAAQQRYAAHVDRNQSIISQRAKAEQDRLQNEMSLCYSLYNSCAQQVQAAKAKIQLDTPVFYVIDPPQVPFRGKPRLSSVVLLFIVLGLVFGAVWVLWGQKATASLKSIIKKEPAPAPEEESQA